MIVAEVMDGIGNQLFQYAAARALALRQSTTLELNTRWFSRSSYRGYGLPHFRIAATRASTLTLIPYFQKVQDLRLKLLGSYSKQYFKEQSMRFDPAVLELRGNIYLRGHFQCERYFIDFADNIRQELSLVSALPLPLSNLAEQMLASNSASIHVRRGDFATTTGAQFALPVSYYEQAITKMRDIIGDPSFYIFTDDPEWVRENLNVGAGAILVSDRATQDYHELVLMSKCKHQIIANSTFSWWGAWLNANPDKIIIAPKQWLRDNSPLDPTDVVPDSWLRL